MLNSQSPKQIPFIKNNLNKLTEISKSLNLRQNSFTKAPGETISMSNSYIKYILIMITVITVSSILLLLCIRNKNIFFFCKLKQLETEIAPKINEDILLETCSESHGKSPPKIV